MNSGVYLDAYVLACPQVDEGISSFWTYIENLISWSELKKADWVELYISQNASEALAQANAFPPFPVIKDTIARLSINHIQPKDVNELVISFLTKSSIIEDELDINDLLYNDLRIEPIIPLEQRLTPFPDHFNLLSVLLSLHQHYKPDINNQILITAPDGVHSGVTMISARIPILLTNSTKAIPNNEPLPLITSSHFFISRCEHTLHVYLDPCNIWSNARCEFALKKAIELYVYQNQQCQSPYSCPLDYNSFSFGRHFIQSCENLGFSHENLKIRMLLRACTETVLRTNTLDTHWIRTGAGSTAPQLKRGTDGAWRRDIDYEYHLHYWVTPNGPQFANVVHHCDISIPFD